MRRWMVAAIATAIGAGVVPGALAAPADLDSGFGTGGFAVLPGGDRYGAQYAPLLQEDGRILGIGLLRNSSARAFVERFTAAGAIDTSFGNAGEIHTNSVAPFRSAPATRTPGGRLVVVAGSSKNGRITLERFLANGQVDTSFGPSGNGRLAVDLGGTYVNPTAAAALSDGGTLVTALSNRDGVHMTLLKFTRTGLDPSFGSGGIARARFARSSRAHDLAVLSNGAILVVGAVGSEDPASAGNDVAAARFTAAGVLDPSFGASGLATLDATGNQTGDHAVAVAADDSGAFAVAGPAGSRGMVARFTSTGVRDGSFAVHGVQLGGFAPAGTRFAPADVALDASGRMVVTGTASAVGGISPTSRWLVARLERRGGDTLDGSFADGGAVQFAQCANTAGHGPSGLAIQPDSRIVVLGSCGDDGAVALARLFGTRAFPSAATLSVSPGREAAGHERVPLAGIDPVTVLGAVDRYASAPLGSGPLGSGPLGSGPLGSGPLGSGPLGSGPLGSGPLGSGPLGSGPLGSGPLGSGPLGSGPINSQILLSDLPLLNGQTWTELLAPSYPGGAVPPLQTITLADAYRLNPATIDALGYADIDITRTPLRTASLAAVLLTRPLQDVAPPAGGWCDWLAAARAPLNCSNGADPSRTTLLELEFAGVDLSAYYREPLFLARSSGTNLGSGDQRAMLAHLDLRQVEVAHTPFGDVPAAEIAPLLACNPDCPGTVAEQQRKDVGGWTSATVGDLIAALPLTSLPNVSLGQLLAGMVNVAEIPFERARARELLDAAVLRSEQLQTYDVAFRADCAQAAGLQVAPRLADDARLVPGSAAASVNGAAYVALPDARRDADGRPVFDLADACVGRSGQIVDVQVRFDAEPGSRLGPKSAAVVVRTPLESRSAGIGTGVDDSRDPGDEPTQTRALGTEDLLHGWISHARDVDYYSFTAPAAGTRVSITLNHVPEGADFDLHVYGPVSDVATGPLHSGPLGSGPLGSGPLGSGPLGSGAVRDSTGDALDPAISQPDPVRDLPIGSGPLGSGPLGSGSINRGNADEAVTFRVRRADAGRVITVQVSGYVGSSAADPYALRRSDIVPPPAPSCPATAIVPGAAGQWPAGVPDGTRALYLVNRARLAGLNSEAQADAVMARLATLAEQTDGVVVPVESSPSTDTSAAYAAWDQHPCDEDRANAVVSQINRVVEDVMRAGDGLRKLESIVLVGPDAVIPQARLRDDSVLSNEDEYADEAMFDGNDNAVSGALRDAFILSDDPYGDFDVSRAMYVPDVALGRLVETAPEISRQIQRFLDTGGVIDPADAAVMGYDLFDDGSIEQAEALGTTARVDDWDAAAALSTINRPGAGFTAVNGHYDHYRGLPAAAFSGSGAPDLLLAADAQPNAGGVLFTMGCHSGLNISARVLGPDDEEQLRLGDWAQRMAQSDALWMGSTGFSYGDTEAVAYTERIMIDAAANMASRKVTVGQALMFAKQKGVSTAGVLDVYYVKASQEATFYGLPMYRIGREGGVGDPAMPPPPPEGEGSQASDPLSFSFGDQLVEHTSDRGVFYTVGDQAPMIVQGRPLQPIATTDVTAESGQARGYLIEQLTTTERPASDPVIARPTVDLAAHEPEPIVRSPLFPAQLATVTSVATPSGRRDRLTVAAGQFRGDHQRLFTAVGGRVMRSTGTDFEPLVIRRVDGAVTGDTFAVRVEVQGGGAAGGNVLYRTDADSGSTVEWHRADLAVIADGLLGTGGTLPGGTKIAEAIVQVYDSAYNVSLSDYKVVGYSFEPITQPNPGEGPTVIFDPDVPPSGYLTTTPRVMLDPGSHAQASFEYSIDGAAWRPYESGSSLVLADAVDGQHRVEFRGSDGSTAARSFAIDRQGPVVLAEPDRPAGGGGWHSGPVTVTFRCSDAVSGVASCPAPVRVQEDGAGRAVSGTATDRAGNAGSGGMSVSIDSAPPAISGDISPEPESNGWYWRAPTVAWTCEDALSGIATCPEDEVLGEGAGQKVKGTAADRAGNETGAEVGPVDVDLQDGTVAISTPNGAILLRGQSLQGTAGDTVTGSGIASVVATYTPTIGTTTTRSATFSCDEDNRCTWSAPLPPTGINYRVTVRATEVSGRSFPAERTITITVN